MGVKPKYTDGRTDLSTSPQPPQLEGKEELDTEVKRLKKRVCQVEDVVLTLEQWAKDLSRTDGPILQATKPTKTDDVKGSDWYGKVPGLHACAPCVAGCTEDEFTKNVSRGVIIQKK